MRIFITGVTGFLGYHIAVSCVCNGHKVLCLRRNSSVSLFDNDIEQSITWVNSDKNDWIASVRDFHPDVLIHCAWSGVSIQDRNNYDIQKHNISLSQTLFNIVNYDQIIVLGSQEEYGKVDSVIDESYPLDPLTEYAKAKVITCKLLSKHAVQNNIEWQWIRIFTVYGEKQNENWLIPSMIKKCKDYSIKEIETTRGEQVYSYLYSSDFSDAIVSILGKKGKSGIYNLSATTPIRLKDLFAAIKLKTCSEVIFKPVLPYRQNQSMLIMSDCQKFKSAFGEYEKTTLSEGLDNIIKVM